MDIHSVAFEQNQSIPSKYTCEGENISPPLNFQNIPAAAKSLALIVDDPDAPGGQTFVHWVVWNIDPKLTTISEGASFPHQGSNHYKVNEYRGPCPPQGQTHRYFFKLYALDIDLDIPQGSSKEKLEEAMKGHTISQAEMIGTYKKR